MKLLAATLASLSFIASSMAQADEPSSSSPRPQTPTIEDIRMVAPALEKYWPNAFSAATIAKDVFQKRSN